MSEWVSVVTSGRNNRKKKNKKKAGKNRTQKAKQNKKKTRNSAGVQTLYSVVLNAFSELPLHPLTTKELYRIIYEYAQNENDVMITVWELTSADLVLQLPLDLSAQQNLVLWVSWEEGCSNSEFKHTYQTPGKKVVRVSGALGFGFGQETKNSPNNLNNKLVDIVQWGDVRLSKHGYQFRNCRNLGDITASDAPDLRGITNLSYMFYLCNSFNGMSLAQWDVSKVDNFERMFDCALRFEGDLSRWRIKPGANMIMMCNCLRELCYPPGYRAFMERYDRSLE
jgi:hypothetical protein